MNTASLSNNPARLHNNTASLNNNPASFHRISANRQLSPLIDRRQKLHRIELVIELPK